MHNPMEQFEIKRLIPLHLGGLDVSYTNAALWMTIAIALMAFIFVYGMRRQALIPGRLQGVAESGYEFIAKMVSDNVGEGGKKYFPFILTLFLFVLGCNALGLIPYSFTPTSHIIVTFAMAAFVFIGVTIIAFFKHGLHFFSFFAPKGVPLWLMPILVPIEVISYLIRPLTLSVRLFANVILGFALAEATGLFGLVVALLLLFVL